MFQISKEECRAGRGRHPPVFCSFLFFALLLFASCASVKKETEAPVQSETRRELIKKDPAETPAWVNAPPKTEGEIYFVGVSRGFNNPADARKAARDDAFNQILKFYGQYIKSTGFEKSSSSGADIFTPYIEKAEEITSFAENVVSQVNTDKYYTETFLTHNKDEYVVYVLCQISRAKAEGEIENFAGNVSARYGNLIGQQTTLADALLVYTNIYNSLSANPLHRALAYYESAQGRVGLYNYCYLQINSIAGSVNFDAIQNQLAQKGETINTTVRLSSSQFKSIGSASCRVSIAGGRNTAPVAAYPLGKDNSFLLQIHSDKLDAGKYNVQLELILNEISADVKTNPKGGFSFEITPLNSAQIILQGDAQGIAAKIKQLVQDQDILLVESGAAYLIIAKLDITETQTENYYVLHPTLTITVELERNGNTLVTYTKKYPEFKHITKDEAYKRAYRNIENDLSGEFAMKMRALGRE